MVYGSYNLRVWMMQSDKTTDMEVVLFDVIDTTA